MMHDDFIRYGYIYGIGLGLGPHIGLRDLRLRNRRLRTGEEVVEVVVVVEVVEVVVRPESE